MKTHNLKITCKNFEAILFEGKKCEVRKNDRDFKVGDMIVLQEFDNGEYTGNTISAKKITHIETFAQVDDYVVLSIEWN